MVVAFHTSLVIDPLLPRPPKPESSRQKRPRRGGWPLSGALPWQVVKDIHDLAHRADYNAILNIMPQTGTPPERKRFVSRTVARLGQSLHRCGKAHSGTTIYEQTATADLHGHHLFHLDPEDRDILAKYDSIVVLAQTFTGRDRPRVVSYCTKQRVSLPPEHEAKLCNGPVRHLRQRSLPIRGRRVSHTKLALGILVDIEDGRNFGRSPR